MTAAVDSGTRGLIDRTLVIGDSWSSAVVAGDPAHGGWPQILGIPQQLRQAVSGSTAAQWAADFGGRLTRARETDADAVVLSLMGNDARRAAADGRVTLREAASALTALRRAVSAVRKPRTLVLLYANPLPGLRFAAGHAVLVAAIRLVLPRRVEIVDAGEVLRARHFDGVDIHPTLAGHYALAALVASHLAAGGAP